MLTIAVSGINAMENPGPGTGIIRSLRASDLDIRIIGLAYDAMEPGVYLGHLVDAVYLMPYPSGGKTAFFNRLAYIHTQENLDAIIPALDTEFPIFMGIERTLKQMDIKMLIPDRRMYHQRDKTRLAELAQLLEIKTPDSEICDSRADFTAAIDRFGFPCMIKGPFYEAFQAQCYIEAQNAFYKLLNTWGYPVIVQAFIAGEEYDVVGCGDGRGGDLGFFAIKKLVTTSLGKVWNAVSVRNEHLIRAAQQFVAGLSWRGGFELELIIARDTAEAYLLEVNPRFPAWVYMGAACGVNLPERMIRLVSGLPVERHSNYSSGKLMIRYVEELVKDISDYERISTAGEIHVTRRPLQLKAA